LRVLQFLRCRWTLTRGICSVDDCLLFADPTQSVPRPKLLTWNDLSASSPKWLRECLTTDGKTFPCKNYLQNLPQRRQGWCMSTFAAKPVARFASTDNKMTISTSFALHGERLREQDRHLVLLGDSRNPKGTKNNNYR
jgi:hypothetical protein